MLCLKGVNTGGCGWYGGWVVLWMGLFLLCRWIDTEGDTGSPDEFDQFVFKVVREGDDDAEIVCPYDEHAVAGKIQEPKKGGSTYDECTTLLLLSARQIIDRFNNLYACVGIDIQRERIVRHGIQRSMYCCASYFYCHQWIQRAYGCFERCETFVSVWEYVELAWLDEETDPGGDVFFCWAEP
jgi:hypothetical protein